MATFRGPWQDGPQNTGVFDAGYWVRGHGHLDASFHGPSPGQDWEAIRCSFEHARELSNAIDDSLNWWSFDNGPAWDNVPNRLSYDGPPGNCPVPTFNAGADGSMGTQAEQVLFVGTSYYCSSTGWGALGFIPTLDMFVHYGLWSWEIQPYFMTTAEQNAATGTWPTGATDIEWESQYKQPLSAVLTYGGPTVGSGDTIFVYDVSASVTVPPTGSDARVSYKQPGGPYLGQHPSGQHPRPFQGGGVPTSRGFQVPSGTVIEPLLPGDTFTYWAVCNRALAGTPPPESGSVFGTTVTHGVNMTMTMTITYQLPRYRFLYTSTDYTHSPPEPNSVVSERVDIEKTTYHLTLGPQRQREEFSRNIPPY